MNKDGDNHLSSFDLKLWSLHQHIIVRWSCYTIFKVYHYNVPRQIDGLIMWFVPADHPFTYEVVKFLEHELETEKREATHFEPDLNFPGVDVKVSILTFSGIEPYLERSQVEKLAQESLNTLLKWKKGHDKKENKS